MQSTGRWPSADSFAIDTIRGDRQDFEQDVTFMRETCGKLQLATQHINRQNEEICQLREALATCEKALKHKEILEDNVKHLERQLEDAHKANTSLN